MVLRNWDKLYNTYQRNYERELEKGYILKPKLSKPAYRKAFNLWTNMQNGDVTNVQRTIIKYDRQFTPAQVRAIVKSNSEIVKKAKKEMGKPAKTTAGKQQLAQMITNELIKQRAEELKAQGFSGYEIANQIGTEYFGS